MKLAAVGLAMSLALAVPNHAVASDSSDLWARAVYCSAVAKHLIARAQGNSSTLAAMGPAHQRAVQDAVQTMTTNFDRLRAYVLSNMHFGDIHEGMSFMTALKRGELDEAQCGKEFTQNLTCIRACTNRCALDLPCHQKCDARCGAPSCARTDGCIDTSWLPY